MAEGKMTVKVELSDLFYEKMDRIVKALEELAQESKPAYVVDTHISAGALITKEEFDEKFGPTQ